MISSKFLATTALAAAVVGSIGLAYAQTAVPTPDSARVESNKATTQPGSTGTTMTTQGNTGMAGSTGTSTTTGTTGTMGMPATPMRADAPLRDQSGTLRSDNMNRNTNNSGSDMAGGTTTRTERAARADRN